VLLGPLTDAPEYVAHIRQRAKELGIEHQVIARGFTTNVAPAYRAADFFCLPSKNEGLPNAMLEAMASGLPCIVTPISGCVDLVEDGQNSRIVDGSPGAIAEAVGSYMTDSALAKAHEQAVRDRIVRQYSCEVVGDLHEALYRRLMTGQDAAGS
jgi:glycosyltransferase involved in cell wall biosynthesis